MLDQFADDAVARLREAMAVDDALRFRLGVDSPYEYMWEEPPDDADESTWLLDAIDEADYWEVAQETGIIVQVSAGVKLLDQVRHLVGC